MPISMWVRKEMPERGARVEESAVAWKPRGLLNHRDTPLLVAVDPVGATVFNRFQCERQMPREISYLRENLADAREIAMLDELERLAQIVTHRVHHYLWFVGD